MASSYSLVDMTSSMVARRDNKNKLLVRISFSVDSLNSSFSLVSLRRRLNSSEFQSSQVLEDSSSKESAVLLFRISTYAFLLIIETSVSINSNLLYSQARVLVRSSSSQRQRRLFQQYLRHSGRLLQTYKMKKYHIYWKDKNDIEIIQNNKTIDYYFNYLFKEDLL